MSALEHAELETFRQHLLDEEAYESCGLSYAEPRLVTRRPWAAGSSPVGRMM